MKMIKLMTFMAFTLSTAKIFAQIQPCPDPANNPNWSSIYSNDFNYTDTAVFKNSWGQGVGCDLWNPFVYGTFTHDTAYEQSWTHNNCHNFECYGSSSPSYIRLIMKNESTPYRGYYFDTTGSEQTKYYNWTKGAISIPNFSGWKYGYFEMRFRIPDWSWRCWNSDSLHRGWHTNIQGLASAWWMFEHDSINNAPWSEIDIMETFDGFNNHTDNVHWSPDSAYYNSSSPYYYKAKNPISFYDSYGNDKAMTFSSNFHLLSMEWTPDYVKVFYDSALIHISCNYSDKLVKMGTIIDLGINSYKSFGYKYNDSCGSINPYYYDIDYFKVWKLKNDSCSLSGGTTLNKIDPATYPYGVKKFIHVTGNAQTTINSGDNVILMASDYILIDKNFVVKKGAAFEMLPQKCY